MEAVRSLMTIIKTKQIDIFLEVHAEDVKIGGRRRDAILGPGT
jgi:hypothetical protein